MIDEIENDEGGPEVVYVDDRPPTLRGAWDDLDDAYDVTGLWNRYATSDRSFYWDSDEGDSTIRDESREAAARKVASAHKMVQGFVSTFAPAGERYEVTFDPTIETERTDLTNRKIGITPLPLFDPTLTFEQAGQVLLAMGAHGAAHTRFGKRTANATHKRWPRSWADPIHELATRIGNILDDVAIEREYQVAYPGFANIFDPAAEYIAQASLSRIGAERFTPRIADPGNLVAGSLRWSKYCDWSDPAVVAERDWFIAWADRALARRTAATHVAAIEDALQHIADMTPPPPPTPEQKLGDSEQGTNEDDKQDDESEQAPSGPAETPESGRSSGSDDNGEAREGGGDEGDANGGGGQFSADELIELEVTPEDFQTTQDEPAKADPSRESGRMPGCLGDAIEDAARDNDATRALSNAEAQQAVAEEARLVDVTISHNGNDIAVRGEIIYSTRGLSKPALWSNVGNAASAAIRAAFARSRTGHGAVDRRLARGSLDSRNLYRIGQRDGGIFRRKRAVSVGKYKVWLLVDCSGSMGGYPIVDATAVASALASATRSLPNITLDIWGWTTPNRRTLPSSHFICQRVWTRGLPTENVSSLMTIPRGGTPDNMVIEWASKALAEQCGIDEEGIIILASDGAGELDATAIKKARKRGVSIVSVAIGPAVRPIHQRTTFGDGNFIEWGGSILASARPLGHMLGRIAAGKSQKG